jgi:anti-sigma B factor antagonist
MLINSFTKDNILTIQFLAERLMDEGQLKRISTDLLALLDKSTQRQVILDFSKVKFMSSSMLGKLVQLHKKCKEYKVKLKLCGISPDIYEVFKITKLHKLFDLESDEASARKAFLKRGLFG